MHVLLVAQYFWPEQIGCCVWIHQLATDLARKGHRVTMLTAFPNYPEGKVFEGYQGRFFQRETVGGVEVIRTYIHATPDKSFWAKALCFGSFCVSSRLGGAFCSRPDVIFCVMPPLPLGQSALWIGWMKRAPVVLSIQDIYPDLAIRLGYLRNRLAVRFFQRMERSIYRRAASVRVIADSFRDNLMQKGVPREKIHVIPNWVDTSSVQPGPKRNAFRQEQARNGEFLIVYSGGMGHNTCLAEVVEAARLLQGERFRFLLIGDGVYRSALEARAREYGLSNVQFLPFQPMEKYTEVLAASDLQLVALNESAAQMSLPSKALNIMASGRPVLALALPESDLARLVVEANCGAVTPPSHPAALAEAIRRLAENPAELEAMGRNARNFLLANFEREHCIARIESVLAGAMRTTGGTAVSDRFPAIREDLS
ncbi:MAG: glycosyltransferase family 4 protein [Terriglobia bacterium]